MVTRSRATLVKTSFLPVEAAIGREVQELLGVSYINLKCIRSASQFGIWPSLTTLKQNLSTRTLKKGRGNKKNL